MAFPVVACGGDEEAGTVTSEPTPTNSAGTLQFDQVENFTLTYLEGEKAVRSECKELSWVEEESQKRELAPFTGTKSTEVLTCDEVPYLAYLEYEDAAAADEGLASALLPYLLVGDTTIVMPLAGVDEATASRYLEAVEAECACGELIQP
jgi:hypothetical protein